MSSGAVPELVTVRVFDELLPSSTSPKSILAACTDGAVAVPDSETASGLEGLVSWICSVPVLLPAVWGANVTVIVQLSPLLASTAPVQPPSCAKSADPAEIDELTTVTDVVPVLVTVTFAVDGGSEIFCVPNGTLLG